MLCKQRLLSANLIDAAGTGALPLSNGPAGSQGQTAFQGQETDAGLLLPAPARRGNERQIAHDLSKNYINHSAARIQMGKLGGGADTRFQEAASYSLCLGSDEISCPSGMHLPLASREGVRKAWGRRQGGRSCLGREGDRARGRQPLSQRQGLSAAPCPPQGQAGTLPGREGGHVDTWDLSPSPATPSNAP